METVAQMQAMDGTEGREEFMLIGNQAYRQYEYESEREAIATQYKRWPKWFPKEWKVNYVKTWTWKFGYTRQQYPTCFRTDCKATNLETGEVETGLMF